MSITALLTSSNARRNASLARFAVASARASCSAARSSSDHDCSRLYRAGIDATYAANASRSPPLRCRNSFNASASVGVVFVPRASSLASHAIIAARGTTIKSLVARVDASIVSRANTPRRVVVVVPVVVVTARTSSASSSHDTPRARAHRASVVVVVVVVGRAVASRVARLRSLDVVVRRSRVRVRRIARRSRSRRR